ncbi:hypothetical protein CW731_13695 [Polaribacter sp. ALD11]|uniref:hypothetical protein n=1 Tax=Polaribacter sp. ALD11 TaxID=2058137 RepID=UPI000C302881|nr:hypothetical protein [Polaribacter sp. ALD11]AUC86266.1 hypothetical protein CW731_13695 [Polaribacter sp. ALD11]
MKKVLVSLAVVALLATSCKKAKETGTDIKDATVEAAEKAADATEDAANAVVEGTKEVISEVKESDLEGVTIPEFENEEATEFLEDYAAHAKEYIEAKGDVVKNSKLAKESVEFAKKSKEIVSNLDAKAAAKFKSVMNAIQSKMAPAK